MVWGAIAAAGISVASGLIGGASADKRAASAAKQQAKLTGARRDEEIRQTRTARAAEAGGIRAAIGASNLQLSGSSARYLRAAESEGRREIAWLERANQLEQRAIRKGAQGAGDALRIGGISKGLSSAVSAAIDAWG